ncbi:MAG: hypothetical protein BAA01_15955 [Bacillus thermozeamaize]|uniref:Spore coat protein B n=1 Tax=Bacillus thermozeamaize TaxID=230954 RepID=A0A1Y3Q146_9BACI|nr:MAG: hypothetical protein BAA01_15955 [Bacillus thermozeamaize]
MDQTGLNLVIGQSVRVDRGGPEARIGKLVAVKKDHVVVYHEEEGMLYYKSDHIKSLSLDSRENPEDLLMENPDETPLVLPKYIDAEDFLSVMKNMKYRWVQVNRGGPEKIEGVLVDANDAEVTLVVGNEVIRVMTFHIRNISYGIKKKEQENKNSEENENNQEKDNQNKEKDKDHSKEKDDRKEKSDHKEKDNHKEKEQHKEKGERKEKGNHSKHK